MRIVRQVRQIEAAEWFSQTVRSGTNSKEKVSRKRHKGKREKI